MSVTFTPISQNDWIHEIPTEDTDVQLNSMLFLARKALKCFTNTPVAAFNEEHAQAFQRVYDMLAVAVPQIVHNQHASSAKGNAAEKSYDDMIADAFPQCQLYDTSHQPRSGDRVLACNDQKVIIEYKDYSRPVPSKEIAKFERDLKENSAKVGIMCVFESHICKKPTNKTSIEHVGDAVAIYVPHAGRDGSKLLIALEFAIWMLKHNANSNACDKEAFARIALSCIDEVDTLVRDLASISEHMQKEMNRLNESRLTALTTLRARLGQLM